MYVLFWTGGKRMDNLSPRRKRILEWIEQSIAVNGYPPTCEEIRAGLRLKSTSMVHRELEALEEAGHLQRTPGVSRGLRLYQPRTNDGVYSVPILGAIAAGEPIGFGDPIYNALRLTSDIVRQQEGLFALRVKGDSMIDALVNDGDIVVMKRQQEARNGEMVAVRLLDRDETTLKHFYRENGHVRLQPANPTVAPIYVHPSQVEIQGRVVAIVRQLDMAA
jgi:repressor LexA